ncbi:hypothetical protein FHX15_005364 [Rhizobium sp. BK650]|nr:hypothetical protein [Rhizobium sp. BK650]
MKKSPYLKPLRDRIARSCLEVLAMEDIASSRLGLELFCGPKKQRPFRGCYYILSGEAGRNCKSKHDSLQNNA